MRIGVFHPYNRITSDDTYTYEYDDEGNLVYRYETNSPGQRMYYTWDHRNRLVHVSQLDNEHEVLTVDYVYDANNQLVAKRTEKPFESGPSSTVFVHDGGQVVLQFDAQFESTPVDLEASDLTHRYVWGPGVDQLLADEQVTSLEAAGEVLWAMTDNVGSVRDVIDSDGDLRIHRQFDAFGNVVDETHFDTSGDPVTSTDPGYVDEAFGFTGRWLDKDTGLQNNLNRWYNSTTGRWLSEDPIGFAGWDANLYRFVANAPTMYVDQSGLRWGWPSWHDYTHYLWHPSEMDSDIQTGQRISLGVAAAAGGGALGVYAGGAYAASAIAAGENVAVATGAGNVIAVTVGTNAGYAFGRPFGQDVANMGSFGASYLMPLAMARVNKVQPCPGAGPHSGFKINPQTGKITGYTEFDANGCPIKRLDVAGTSHGGVPTPHVHEYGPPNINTQTGQVFPPNEIGIRPALPGEMPK